MRFCILSYGFWCLTSFCSVSLLVLLETREKKWFKSPFSYLILNIALPPQGKLVKQTEKQIIKLPLPPQDKLVSSITQEDFEAPTSQEDEVSHLHVFNNKQPLAPLLPTKLILRRTRRYGPLRGPTSSSCGGLWPLAEAFFCPSGQKKSLLCCFGPFLAFFGVQ